MLPKIYFRKYSQKNNIKLIFRLKTTRKWRRWQFWYMKRPCKDRKKDCLSISSIRKYIMKLTDTDICVMFSFVTLFAVLFPTPLFTSPCISLIDNRHSTLGRFLPPILATGCSNMSTEKVFNQKIWRNNNMAEYYTSLEIWVDSKPFLRFALTGVRGRMDLCYSSRDWSPWSLLCYPDQGPPTLFP